jgi:hypothetical protein
MLIRYKTAIKTRLKYLQNIDNLQLFLDEYTNGPKLPALALPLTGS